MLGCGSAKPSVRHNPSCTVVEHHSNLYMIDCGEGAQQMFQQMRLKFSKLSHIFLTHLHGDHVFGLPGLIGTLALSGRKGSITIHTFADGAAELQRILAYFSRQNPVEVRFNILDANKSEIALETRNLIVRTVPLKHSLPCVGYIFEEKPGLRHIRREMIDFYNIPYSQINNIKSGADFVTADGRVIENERLTTAAAPAKKYVHIADTRVKPSILSAIEGADLLYHETTYLNETNAEAISRYHSTASQAGMMARESGAKRLVTGHYSSRYKDLEEFRRQASEEFQGSIILGDEGVVIEV